MMVELLEERELKWEGNDSSGRRGFWASWNPWKRLRSSAETWLRAVPILPMSDVRHPEPERGGLCVDTRECCSSLLFSPHTHPISFGSADNE